MIQSTLDLISQFIEQGIQKVHSGQQIPTHQIHAWDSLDSEGIGGTFISVGRLSKAGLCRAQILAQLDKKFLLAKMPKYTDGCSEASVETEILVLIDQHAADERVQVEELFADLCKPLAIDDNQSGYRSKLGHQSPFQIPNRRPFQ